MGNNRAENMKVLLIKDALIRKIPYKLAMEIVVEKHYLHRKTPCSFSFGLFWEDFLGGVICYGTPSSSPLRKGICGDAEKCNVIELTRLWIDDICPKNSASFLIGNTIKKVDKEIIVSFADTSQDHLGTVYQATNWIYTGLSAKRTNWTIDGDSRHCQTLADKYTSKEIRTIYGDRFSLQPRPRKHRYVYFNCTRNRKKELLLKLRYPIKPYPMAEQWG